jgi:hypothetical protein
VSGNYTRRCTVTSRHWLRQYWVVRRQSLGERLSSWYHVYWQGQRQIGKESVGTYVSYLHLDPRSVQTSLEVSLKGRMKVHGRRNNNLTNAWVWLRTPKLLVKPITFTWVTTQTQKQTGWSTRRDHSFTHFTDWQSHPLHGLTAWSTSRIDSIIHFMDRQYHPLYGLKENEQENFMNRQAVMRIFYCSRNESPQRIREETEGSPPTDAEFTTTTAFYDL